MLSSVCSYANLLVSRGSVVRVACTAFPSKPIFITGTTGPQRFMYIGNYAKPRKQLHEIIRLETLVKNTKDEIAEIWLKGHENKTNHTAHVMPKQLYDKLASRSKDHGFFALPLFSLDNAGFKVVVVQFSAKQCSFTGLNEYKLSPMTATPYALFHFYDDMIHADQQIALIRGEIVDPRILKKQVEQIWSLIERFYTSDEDFQYVNIFNKQPNRFDYTKFFEYVQKSTKLADFRKKTA